MRGHLFLSPHFDDAVGSCGGWISRLLAEGSAVRVVTVFGGMQIEPFSTPAEILHDEWKLGNPVPQRREEDARACRILGCERSFLDIPDAIYRQDTSGRHLYPTFEALKGAPADADRDLPTKIVELLGDHVEDETSVYCPAGIGGHVDHTLGRACGSLLTSRGIAVSYYKEFYYEGSTDSAMKTRSISLTEREIAKKVAAFSCYASQIGDLFGDAAEMKRYFETVGRKETIFTLPPSS